MKRTSLIGLAALTFAGPVHAQALWNQSGARTRDLWIFDLGPQFVRPVRDFRANVDKALGFGAAVRYALPRTRILGLRADFAFHNYGNERKRVPMSSTVNRVVVEMNTRNNIALATAGPELALRHGWFRPYVYAFAGFSYLYTETTVSDDNADDGGFARTTHLDDGGWASGWGSGLRIPLGLSRVDAALDASARLTRNGQRTYLRRGDIVDLPDGTLLLNERRSAVDFWQFQLGMSFSPRRRL